MPFLSDEDYSPFITQEELNAISGNNPLNRQKAESSAQSKISQYLQRQYDVEAIFGATGSDRHQTIIEYMVYFVIYILHSRVAKQQMSESRQQQYNEARDFLESVKNDEITTDFPRLLTPENDDLNPAVRGGSTTFIY